MKPSWQHPRARCEHRWMYRVSYCVNNGTWLLGDYEFCALLCGRVHNVCESRTMCKSTSTQHQVLLSLIQIGEIVELTCVQQVVCYICSIVICFKYDPFCLVYGRLSEKLVPAYTQSGCRQPTLIFNNASTSGVTVFDTLSIPGGTVTLPLQYVQYVAILKWTVSFQRFWHCWILVCGRDQNCITAFELSSFHQF